MRRSAYFSLTAGKRPRHASAFTLIELLVVIAIIAILAAILFPVFAQAREKARQAACLSNTKQIALAVMQYAQDFDETLPVGGRNTNCRGRWTWQIYPYLKNGDVFTCPNTPSNVWTTRQVELNFPGCRGRNFVGDSDRGGYGWNASLFSELVTNNAASGFPLASIGKPASTIIVGDTGYDEPDPTATNGATNASASWVMVSSDPRKALSGTYSQPGLYPQFRHTAQATKPAARGWKMPIRGRANFVFLDGHAKSLALETAFESAPLIGGVPTEDGKALRAEPGTLPDHGYPDIEYVLWNIY